MVVPVSAGAGPVAGTDAWQVQAYSLRAIDGQLDRQRYEALLAQVYEPLGFMTDGVLPGRQSRCFVIEYRAAIVAIYRLTEVDDPRSPYHDLLPGDGGHARDLRLLEVNNVVITRPMRSTILLGLMLHAAASWAHAAGYDRIVGMTRYQTLRFFVEFGVVPIDHAPLHLLGRPELKDFAIYYNTRDPESIAYMHERARRWFHQKAVMRAIECKYIGRVGADVGRRQAA